MHWYIVLLMAAILSMTGCGGGSSGADPAIEVDSDGDGISDVDEKEIWYTNPILDDTDGDGWTDGEEINFGSAFSPLIANMPRLKMAITQSPSITLNYTETTGESSSREVVTGTSTSSEVSDYQSFAHTTSLQHGWSVEVNGQIGSDSFVGFAAGYNGSYTSEDSYEWGSTRTVENTQSVENAETFATDNSITYNDGTMAVTAKLINPSDIAYTIKSITVTSSAMDTGVSGSYRSIGNMEMDGSFSEMTLAPSSETGEFVFTKILPVGDAKNLAYQVPSLVYSLAGYSISMTDENGKPKDFTYEMTEVAALCAKVIIDKGAAANQEPKQYIVATRTKYNENYTSQEDIYEAVSLREVLSYIGLEEESDYTLGANGHIDMLLDVSEDETVNSQWVISLEQEDEDVIFLTKEDGYDINSTVIKPGDIVNIFFSEDKDGDGLVKAVENIYDSSDENNDTDGDTIGDFDEVIGWDHDANSSTPNVITNPTLADTDGDGINDDVDEEPTQEYLYSSTDISSLKVEDYQGQLTAFTVDGNTYSAPKIATESALIKVTTAEPVSSVAIDGINMNKDADDEMLYTYSIASLKIGENNFTVVVTSEDGETTGTKTLLIDSALQDVDNTTIVPQGLSSTGGSYQMDVAVNWNGYSDSRADGALLLFKQGDPTDYQLENSFLLPETIKDNGSGQTYASGETAVKLWPVSATTDLGTDFFGASYYNQKYTFRVVVYGQNPGEASYYYSKGDVVSDSYVTPYPAQINVESIRTKISWEHTDGAESDPEFIINENLATPNNTFIQDLATRSDAFPWKPVNEGDYDVTHSVDRIFTIPSTRTDEIFQIWYDIDEDEVAGEHDIVLSKREIQFIGLSGDGLYSMNDEGKYSGTTFIDEETYTDVDKGNITMSWWVTYHTTSVE